MTRATRRRMVAQALHSDGLAMAYSGARSVPTARISAALADRSHDGSPFVDGFRRGLELEMARRGQVDCEDCGHYGPALAGCGCA